MTIPHNVRMPFAYIGFNPRVRGNTLLQYQCLVIGQKLASGAATPGVRYQVNSADHAGALFGYGSILHRQFLQWFRANALSRVYAYALADDGDGVANTRSWTVTADSSVSSGTMAFYISGKRYAVNVDGTTDTPTTIMTRLKNVINADATVPFVASNATGTLTLTAKNKGTLANSFDVRWNLLDSDATPMGLTVAAGSPVAGATDPDDTSVIPLLGDEQYHIIVNPYTANLEDWDEELESRFGPLRQIDGRLYTSLRADYAGTVNAGLSYNSKHIRILHCIAMPSAPMEVAATTAALVARENERNPARPLTDLELPGIVAPPVSERLMFSENNSLLYNGISVHAADTLGKVRIKRIISTYRLNESGAPDISYLDDNTMAILSRLRYDLRNQLWSEFPRAILVDNDTPTSSEGEFVTVNLLRAKCVTIFRDWERNGWVENAQQFIEALLVERDTEDPTRVNFALSPDTTNPLMIMGIDIRFLL